MFILKLFISFAPLDNVNRLIALKSITHATIHATIPQHNKITPKAQRL